MTEQSPLGFFEHYLSNQKVEKVDKFKKKITVTGDKLTEKQRKKLIDVVAKCPVQRTLEGKMEIATV